MAARHPGALTFSCPNYIKVKVNQFVRYVHSCLRLVVLVPTISFSLYSMCLGDGILGLFSIKFVALRCVRSSAAISSLLLVRSN